MNNFWKIIIVFLLVGKVSGCSQFLQTVDLKLNTEDETTQVEFNVVEKVLSFADTQIQNKSPYYRAVLQSGKGDSARIISENLAIKSEFPDQREPIEYKIGVGDTLTLSRLIENNRSEMKSISQWPKNLDNFNYTLGVGDSLGLSLLKVEDNLGQLGQSDETQDQNFLVETQKEIVLETKGRIGSDGSVLLLEVGRLEALGKTIIELQSEVRNILIRNGASPRFQLEVIEFKSQKAYLTINKASRVILLDDQQTTLRAILTSAGIGFTPGVVTRIRLQRDRKEYSMSLRSIFGQNAPNIKIYNGDHIFVEDSSTNLLSGISKVGNDGNVVFAGVGKIKAANRTLRDLRDEISSMIENIPGSENAFQIEITGFSSQKALVIIPGKPGGVIQITNIPVALDEVLGQNGLSIEGDKITRINLQRQGKTYTFTLERLLNSNSQKIYLQSNDKVVVETLAYKENKVFILGGVSPQIFKINPARRETLADILFTSGGALSASGAKRSEVYLLRGSKPVVAYHLDAQSPTRLIVADAMELRPNDILYVAEQPIISFNRTLATILPLRILLRDIQDENIP